MKKISNSTIVSVITRLFILAIIAKIIALGFYLYLPNQGNSIKIKENYLPKYQRVSFKNMIQDAKQKPVKEVKKSIEDSIDNMLLKGLFASKKNSFIIVAMKAKPKKTTILSIGEVFHSYKLKKITKTTAIFEKKSKEYILNFSKPKTKPVTKPGKIRKKSKFQKHIKRK